MRQCNQNVKALQDHPRWKVGTCATHDWAVVSEVQIESSDGLGNSTPPKKKWYSNSFLNSVHLSEKEKTNIPSYLDAIPPLGIKVVIRNSKALLNQKEAMEWPNVARQSAAQDCLAHFFFTGLLNIQTSSFHHLRHLFPGPEMKPMKCKKSSLRSLGPTSNLQGSSYIGISGRTKSHGKAKRILHLSTVRLNGFILWFAPFGPDNLYGPGWISGLLGCLNISGWRIHFRRSSLCMVWQLVGDRPVCSSVVVVARLFICCVLFSSLHSIGVGPWLWHNMRPNVTQTQSRHCTWRAPKNQFRYTYYTPFFHFLPIHLGLTYCDIIPRSVDLVKLHQSWQWGPDTTSLA